MHRARAAAPAPHGQISSSLLSVLPKFAGGPQDDLTAFLQDFDATTLAFHLTEAEKLNFLPLCLTGFARTEFYSAPPHVQANYGQLKEHLKARFLSPEILQRSINELMKQKQDPTESISDYIVALKRLSTHAFQGNVHNYDTILRGVFVEGVLPKYRIPLSWKNPVTFDDAISAILNYEATMEHELSVPAANVRSGPSDDALHFRQDMDSLRQSIDHNMASLHQTIGQNSRDIASLVKTFAQAQPNTSALPQHQAMPSLYSQSRQDQSFPLPPNAFYPQQSSDSFRSFAEESSPQFRPPYCTSCQKMGHDDSTCWYPRYSQGRNRC